MFQKKINLVFPSEFRRDPVTNDWVLIATGRAKRPRSFKQEKREVFEQTKKDCPFCEVEKAKRVILVFSDKLKLLKGNINPKHFPPDWSIVVMPNKYPAVTPSKTLQRQKMGLFESIQGVGEHEVIVFRDHQKELSDFSTQEIKNVLVVYRERMLELKKQRFVYYIALFHNQGQSAGASLSHPHSQIVAIPVIDPDLNKVLKGARDYFKSHKKCVFCEVLKRELKNKERVVYENEKFVVLCPFASRAAFFIQIFPREHHPRFEEILLKDIDLLALALGQALKRLKKSLNSPDYNLYLKTSPCRGEWGFFHWHFEILPRTSIMAGFEFGVGIEISTITPEKAAAFLRKQKI